MGNLDPKKLINTIIDIATVPVWPDRCDDASRTFGIGPGSINFKHDFVDIFDNNLKKLYLYNKDIESTYTYKEFETKFISIFRESIISKIHIDNEDAFKYYSALLAEPVLEYWVFREIHGIAINHPNIIIKLGNFRIFNFGTNKSAANEICGKDLGPILMGDTPELLIAVNVQARHYQKANEIADSLFDKFEKCLKFIIGYNSGRYRVGILNHFDSKIETSYITNNVGQLSGTNRVNGSYEKVTIDDSYFIDPSLGHDRFWKLVGSSKLTSLQERIILAAEWLGQSYGELSKASAFLKAAISLEIIFTYNEKTIITPSILYQIAEGTAMLTGDSADERVKIEKTVKELYSQRSAIAHSGQTDIDENDVYNMYYIAKSVINKLLTCIDLNEITSIEKLYELLKLRKYSTGPFLPLPGGS